MKRIHKIVAGAAGVVGIVAMTAVVAQPAGGMGWGMGGGMGGMGMMQGGMHGAGPGAMGAMAQQNLAQLKTRLAITPQQEAAWQSFEARAAEQATLMQARHELHHQAVADNVAAPDRMEQHVSSMTGLLSGMQALSSAFKDLYAVLTPEQRTIVDQQFGTTGWRGMGHRMHG